MKRRMLIIAVLGSFMLITTRGPVPVYANEETPAATDTPKEKPADSEQPNKSADKSNWKEYIIQKHENFLKWLNENYPDKYEELMGILDKQPDKFANRLEEILRTYDPIRHAQWYNPPLAKVMQEDLILQHRRDQLLHEIRDASSEARDDLIVKLKELVATRFDVIIRKKTLQFEYLSKRLEKLKKDLEKRAAELETLKVEKDNNVDQRMKELLECSGIDWE